MQAYSNNIRLASSPSTTNRNDIDRLAAMAVTVFFLATRVAVCLVHLMADDRPGCHQRRHTIMPAASARCFGLNAACAVRMKTGTQASSNVRYSPKADEPLSLFLRSQWNRFKYMPLNGGTDSNGGSSRTLALTRV